MRRLLVALTFAVALLGGSLAVRSLVAGPARCTMNAHCDDGLFCNGQELCRPGAAEADARGCIPGSPPCADCDEGQRSCRGRCAEEPDRDGDGHRHADCSGGDDCDDDDRTRYPGRPEVCDPAGFDEDCDPRTAGVKDDDGDGAIDVMCRNVVRLAKPAEYDRRPYLPLPAKGPGEEVTFWGGNDCDDADPAVGPQTQRCDGAGVQVCAAEKPAAKAPKLARARYAWMVAPCAAGQVCLPQPNGPGSASGRRGRPRPRRPRSSARGSCPAEVDRSGGRGRKRCGGRTAGVRPGGVAWNVEDLVLENP